MIVFSRKIVSRASLFSVILLHVLVAAALAHTSVEEAKAAKHSSIKKYHKKLKKQDGAIRLIGGSGEHEGKRRIPNVSFADDSCVVNRNDGNFKYWWYEEKNQWKKNHLNRFIAIESLHLKMEQFNRWTEGSSTILRLIECERSLRLKCWLRNAVLGSPINQVNINWFMRISWQPKVINVFRRRIHYSAGPSNQFRAAATDLNSIFHWLSSSGILFLRL